MRQQPAPTVDTRCAYRSSGTGKTLAAELLQEYMPEGKFGRISGEQEKTFWGQGIMDSWFVLWGEARGKLPINTGDFYKIAEGGCACSLLAVCC